MRVVDKETTNLLRHGKDLNFTFLLPCLLMKNHC